MHTLKREQLLAHDRDDVFEFFSRPENLKRITPTHLGFEILTPSPVPMHQGAVIDYTVKAMGVRTRWTTVIAEYKPPVKFVDVQLKGPYSFWHHTHYFDVTPEGTLMTDVVKYQVPYGILGRGLNQLLVQKQLKQIFDYRCSVIQQMFSDKVNKL